MIVLCAGMKLINNELRRTQNELVLPDLEYFALFASSFHSTEIKPQRFHRAQSKIANLCALRVLCYGLTLFPANDANGEME